MKTQQPSNGKQLISSPGAGQRRKIAVIWKAITLCIPLALIALPGVKSSAATLDLVPTSMDGPIQHFFEPFSPIGEDSQTFTFATPLAQLADYDTLRVRIVAPMGQAWHVSSTAAGLYSSSLNFYLRYYPASDPVFSAPWAAITSASFQFDLASGIAPAAVVSGNPYAVPENPGDRLDFSVGIAVTNDFAFTGFTATLRFDNTSVARAYLSSFADSWLGYYYSFSDLNAPDPGALMTLVPIPEPSSIALIGSSLALLAVRSRSFRRSR